MEDLCKSQDAFNEIHYEAIKYAREKDQEELSKPPLFMYTSIYGIIHLIFLFWGIMLAIRSQPPANRVVHITLAIVFSPIYVLSYFIGMLGNNGRVDNNQPGSKVT